MISDTHLGSSAALEEEVKHFINMAYDEYGIRTIFHGGDITTGNSVYRAQVSELDFWGCQQQCERVAEVFPERDGLTYYGILGNHDINFRKTAGIDMGYILHSLRKDIIILGELKSTFMLDSLRVELLHIKSHAHAKSYALEKHIARTVSKGNHPDVILAGHRHVGAYFMSNGIHAFMLPCFEDSNLFVKYNDFVPSIGGIIIEFVFNEDGQVISCIPNFKIYNPKQDELITIKGN